jgi:hypothetical protein
MACRFAVVGNDAPDNFQLAELLRRIRGKDSVARFLDLNHVEPFIENHSDEPLVIFLDLLGFDLLAGTKFIGRVRERHPTAVFSLYVDKAELQARRNELPADWRERLSHYYTLYKEDDHDIKFEPAVRAALQEADWEATYNITHEPIRLTAVFERGLSGTEASHNEQPVGDIAFVSYARGDWDRFVSSLVSDLAKASHRAWIDQDYLAGGEDWMDAIVRGTSRWSIGTSSITTSQSSRSYTDPSTICRSNLRRYTILTLRERIVRARIRTWSASCRACEVPKLRGGTCFDIGRHGWGIDR